MVMEGDQRSGTATLSVVPLLQERFRQLQRMKELRQEQELLKMSSESEKHSSPPTTHSYELLSKKFSDSSLMFLPPKPHCQLSLSLWPDSSPIKRADSRGVTEAPSNLPNSWFSNAPLVCTSPIKLDHNSASDVDTSLRL